MPMKTICTNEDEEEFEVEAIVEWKFACEGDQLSRLYKVHWKGFGVEDETWEPEDNLANSQEILLEFLAQNNLLPTNFKNIILSNEERNETGEHSEFQIKNVIKTKAINEKHISVVDEDIFKTKEGKSTAHKTTEHNRQDKQKKSGIVTIWNGSSTCKLCGKQYAHLADTRRHVKVKHQDVKCLSTAITIKKAYCKNLGCSFKSIWYSNMVGHMKRCTFVEGKSMAHKTTEHNRQDKQLKSEIVTNWNGSSTCKLCGNKYAYLHDARRHVKEKHQDVKCLPTAITNIKADCKNPGCSHKTKWYSNMLAHIKRCPFQNVNPVECASFLIDEETCNTSASTGSGSILSYPTEQERICSIEKENNSYASIVDYIYEGNDNNHPENLIASMPLPLLHSENSASLYSNSSNSVDLHDKCCPFVGNTSPVEYATNVSFSIEEENTCSTPSTEFSSESTISSHHIPKRLMNRHEHSATTLSMYSIEEASMGTERQRRCETETEYNSYESESDVDVDVEQIYHLDKHPTNSFAFSPSLHSENTNAESLYNFSSNSIGVNNNNRSFVEGIVDDDRLQFDINDQSSQNLIPNSIKTPRMPAICKICNNVYKRYEYAISHVRTCHGIESAKAHVVGTIGICEYENCAFTTMRTWSYSKHIQNVHLKNRGTVNGYSNKKKAPESGEEDIVVDVESHEEIVVGVRSPSSLRTTWPSTFPDAVNLPFIDLMVEQNVNNEFVDVIGL